MKSYIIKPYSLKVSEICNKFYSFLPSEHRKIEIRNCNLKTIQDIQEFENVGTQIDVSEYLNFESKYFLGTISCMNGLLYNEKRGERISPNIYESSSKKLKKGDYIVSRNASLGKISYVHKDSNVILNGGLSYLRIKDKYRWYFPAFFMTNYGAEYLTCATSGGGTQQNAKRQNLLDVTIPFPTLKNHKNPEQVEKYISLLVQNMIDKEEWIRKKNENIDELIEKELLENQEEQEFIYRFPRISEIKNEGRLDTGIFSEKFKIKEYLLTSYKLGFSDIFSLKYEISRGQNLQISNIGESWYFDNYKKGSYRLLLSKYFGNRTIDEFSYIGNKNELKIIRKGDIIFSCRGEMGRAYYFPEEIANTITNIDNVHITSNATSIVEKTYLFCILGFLKKEQILDAIACTGSGAPSFTKYQFEKLKIPNFPPEKQSEIAREYYNPLDKNQNLTPENYLESEKNRNAQVGIFQLNMELFELRERLEEVVDAVIQEREIEIVL